MRILLSTVSSDSHTWNLVFLQLLLEEAGHEVVNLGSCVPDELLIETARREQPDAIVISSVNGHGHLDGARLIRAVRADRAVSSIPAMIGGKLGIRGSDNIEHARGLMDAGFDAVFTEGGDPALLNEWLAALIPTRSAPELLPAAEGGR
ncbi:cobalamin B12-binding domain-containing protein [Streptomyces sp. NPDC001820]|uniref:cobalamin B12-binding domain-containing protein n=1 Tax=Streptomyces sp. NPDC001820 TaxID=3364613 RepID=UPI0036B669E0